MLFFFSIPALHNGLGAESHIVAGLVTGCQSGRRAARRGSKRLRENPPEDTMTPALPPLDTLNGRRDTVRRSIVEYLPRRKDPLQGSCASPPRVKQSPKPSRASSFRVLSGGRGGTRCLPALL
ncbi:unnamed protein product [Arctogadus glacialis]